MEIQKLRKARKIVSKAIADIEGQKVLKPFHGHTEALVALEELLSQIEEEIAENEEEV